MKIGILSPSIYMYQRDYSKRIYAPGRIAIELTNKLVEKGLDVTFFTAPDVLTKAELVSAESELLAEKHVIESQQDLPQKDTEIVSLYETKKYYEMGLTTKAYEAALLGTIDIIHAFNSLGHLSHYFAQLLKIPTVHTLHTMPPAVGTLERWRYQKFANQYFLAISAAQKKAFEKAIPEINIIDVIHHGLNSNDFPFGRKSENYFAFVGRISAQKGLDTAIKIAKEAGVSLRVVTHRDGVIEKGRYYQETVRPLLQGLEVKSSTEGEKKKILQHAKALLLPLRGEEAFGMAMIEAMACGTPVIAYNRGSVSEIVRDGLTGFVIEPDEQNEEGSNIIIKKKGIEGMIEAIARIGEIDRATCRKHVEENFSLEKMAQSHNQLYKKVLQGI